MKFNISHERNGVYQSLLVEATAQELAEAFFKEKMPDSRIFGIHVATRDDMKPGKPVMVVPEGYNANRQYFHFSYEGVGGATGILVWARTKEIAKAYFEAQRPGDTVFWIEKEPRDAARWGARVMVVPDDFSMDFIRTRMRSFNEKMAELEKQGFRSGGWDEKTDKTAIVKVGKTWNDNRIVGYMDRELNIEWETKVLSVGRADAYYLEGTVFVEGEVYPFDYNVVTEEVVVHCYSEPGWMTGASYERPLPEVVNEHMEEILEVVSRAVEDWLEAQGYVKLSGKTVDEMIANASSRAEVVEKMQGDVDLEK